jgi:endonuclease/exonuclease/phosphatase family metal-dependent hydrolase
LRIATWNLEWAKPSTPRHQRALAHLESVGADVIVTTEDSVHDWPAFSHRVDGGSDWGYRKVGERRKVIAWSTSPWTDVEVVDNGAMRGRFVAATTSVAGVELRVLAVCIPWRDAHVSTGRRDRQIWTDHVEFCHQLGEVVGSIDGPFVVTGDFNQRIPRRRQPQYVFDALTASLGHGVSIDTAGEFAIGTLIDHVASSEHLSVTAVDPWSNVIDGHRISDHTGMSVDLAT